MRSKVNGPVERVNADRAEICNAAPLPGEPTMPRKCKSTAPEGQAPLDANGLTDQYRQGVLAALPPGVVEPPEQFWRDLETAVVAYLALQEHRSKRPLKRELERWRYIYWLVSELGSELRTIRRQTPLSALDPLWPNRALTALWAVKLKAEAGVGAYETIGRAFRRRKNPHRESLYGAVFNLWRGHLGQQKLGYWRGEGGIRAAR